MNTLHNSIKIKNQEIIYVRSFGYAEICTKRRKELNNHVVRADNDKLIKA